MSSFYIILNKINLSADIKIHMFMAINCNLINEYVCLTGSQADETC